MIGAVGSAERRVPCLFGAALAIALGGAPAIAEDGEHRTVVTPSRRETPAFDTPAHVLVVDREGLVFEQPIDVPDALQGLPGVMVQRTNRGAATPILRGLVGPENLLLVDGVRLNTSIFRTGPNQYAALIDPLALRAVEVVLGPGSVLYGSDALGGTINHLTLAVPRAGTGLELDAQGQSVDLGLGASLYGELADGPLAGWVRGGYRRHGELTVGGGGSWPLSDYEQADWGAKVRLRLGDWSVLAAWLGSWLGDAGRTDNLGRGDVRFSDDLDNLAYVRVQRAGRGALRRFIGTLSLHSLFEREDRRRCHTLEGGAVADRAGCVAGAADAVKALEVREDDVLGLGLQAEAGLGLLEDLELSVGLELRHEWVGSQRLDNDGRGNFSDGSTWGTADAWLWLEADVLGRPSRERIARDAARVLLSGGLRGTTVFASASDVPGLGDVDYDFQGLVGALRASVIVGDGAHLWLGASQGFRAPNLQETTVLGDTGQTFELPNADLEPQKTDTVELGLRLQALDKATFSLVGFGTRVRDAIVRAPATYEGQPTVDGKDVVQRVNATRTEYLGLEAQLTLGPFEGFEIAGALGALEGTLTEADGEETPPRRLPPLQGRFSVGWRSHWKALRVEGGVRFSAAQRRLAEEDRRDLRICGNAEGTAFEDECDGTPGWADLYLGVALAPTEDLSVRLRAENLLDQRYRVHGSGFDQPGFGASLGVTYRL